jgi:tetratricopeptide (TPR) repeat protein
MQLAGYGALRRYEQADAYFERAISLAPDISFNYEQRALNRLCWTGNPSEARAILDDLSVHGSPQLEFVAFYLDLDERKYRQALDRLSLQDLETLTPDDQSRFAARAVVARQRIGDIQGALTLTKANLADLRLRIERFPGNRIYHAYLAVALAQLGLREEAIAEAEQAALQNQHDAFSGPQIVEVQAMVDCILGRRREAIARLDRLLSASYRDPICTAKLRLDPVWDDLRGDDGFKNLLRRYDKKEPTLKEGKWKISK